MTTRTSSKQNFDKQIMVCHFKSLEKIISLRVQSSQVQIEHN